MRNASITMAAVGRLAGWLLKLVVASFAVALVTGMLEAFLDIEGPISILVPPIHTTPRHSPAVQSDLTNLVTANEAYFTDHGRYGTYDELVAEHLFNASSRVTITSTDGNRDGFSATGTHASWPGGICAVYVGDACPSVTVKKRQQEAEVACTREGENRAPKQALALVWLVGAVVTTMVSEAKGRAGTGFVVGILLGPVGLVAAIVLRRTNKRTARSA